MRTTLKSLQPATFKGSDAISFLERNYSRECAYVLVLDDLFPRLALDLHKMQTSITEEMTRGDITLTQVFKTNDMFSRALTDCIQGGSWDIMQIFMSSVPTAAVSPGTRQC